jgi:hypothetical protein
MRKSIIKIYAFVPGYKSLSISLALILLLGFIGSCKKNFVQDNTNPNNATAAQLLQDNVGPGAFIIQMETSVFSTDVNTYQLQENLLGDVWSGYMGGSDNWNGDLNTTNYYMVPNWTLVPFQKAYPGIMAPWLGLKGLTQIAEPDVYAVALILKVEGMHRVTDCYGPLPYSQFGGISLNTPYDSQSSIYSSFFADLDAAIASLTNYVKINPGAEPLAKYDLVYGGDYTKWIRFANSLKLRLAMRIVYADPLNAQKNAQEAVSDTYGVMTSNADNALLQSAGGHVINNPLETIWDSYSDIRMGANMESFLKGYNDPRIGALFVKSTATTPADYHGIRTGINMSDRIPYEALSVLTTTAATPIQWMTASEVYFLRAEGALRNWNMGGTAQSFYEQGIQTSFQQLNVPIPSTYLADATSTAVPYNDIVQPQYSVSTGLSTVTIKWDETASFETNLERVMTQKWIAMYPDGQEAWSEFRRTGYPKLFPVAVNNSNGLISTVGQIRRIPFPNTEYQNDAYEVHKAVNLLTGESSGALTPGDNGGTRLWWDKNPNYKQ